MYGLSDSIAWPSRDPLWMSKVVLIGLIGTIPITRALVLSGGMLTALDDVLAAIVRQYQMNVGPSEMTYPVP